MVRRRARRVRIGFIVKKDFPMQVADFSFTFLADKPDEL
jgi:hypothetical protein